MYKKLQDLKKSKKGFTLVELIVVLVILAILAAILVPTLLGYITKAREEKDYATAQTIRVAAQAVVDEKFGKSTDGTAITGDLTKLTDTEKTEIYTLAGLSSPSAANGTLDNQTVSISSITIKDNQVDAITVNIKPANGKSSDYTYSSSTNAWTAKEGV